MASTTFLDRFRKGLERTREILNADVEDLARGRRPLKPEDLDAMEEALIASDFGMAATHDAMEVLRDRSSQVWTGGVPAMRALLRDEIRKSLDRRLTMRPFATKPWVVFVVGVNGVGKTTTIGKLARTWKAEGRTTLICAADTFRAAAAEQLEIWARRTESPFHRGAEGADPSAVHSDALRIAKSRGHEAVLVDPVFGTFTGREAITGFMARMNVEMVKAGASFSLVELAGSGDTAWAQWKAVTKRGERTGVGVYRTRDGKLTYYRDYMNEPGH